MMDFQNTISSIEVTNFMFHVIRIGSLYESNTDVIVFLFRWYLLKMKKERL